MSHPINRKIIDYLAEENLSFTQLLNKINGSCDHGNFGYHLRRLIGFVELESATKKYKLTYRGKLLLEVIREFRLRLQRGNQPLRYAEQLAKGTHAFSVFKSESFKHEIAFPFLKAGLLKGFAAVYAVPEEKLGAEVLALKKFGVDIESLPTGAFSVLSNFEWYIQKGEAKPKTIMENHLRVLEQKKQAGFKGLQVAAQMAVFIDAGKDKELLQYEKMLGRQLRLDVCALCLFDEKRFAEMGVSDLFQSHGHIISEETYGETIIK